LKPGVLCMLRDFSSMGDQGRCEEKYIGDLLYLCPAPREDTSSGGVRRSGTRGLDSAVGRFRGGGMDAFDRFCTDEK
jgi:hypothetical protein